MKTPEAWEKAELDKYFASIPGIYVVKPATYGFGASGHADRIVCIHGTFWSCEVKRQGKGPTKLQMIRINDVRCAGGKAAWGTAAKIKSEINIWLIEQSKKRDAQVFGL